MTMKFLECIHIFALSWECDLTKRDYNLKTTRIYVIPNSNTVEIVFWHRVFLSIVFFVAKSV